MILQRRVRSVSGQPLAVLEAGAGGRPLLLLHGFTGGAEDFVDHLEPLAREGWHVVAPNQRGHIDSHAPGTEADYSLAIYAAEALRLADEALGWERFTLLGHSMGGMIAQVVAQRAPDRLDGLVLMDTGHGPVDIDPVMAMDAVGLVRAKGIDALAEILTAQADGGPLETPAARRIRETRPDLVAAGAARLRACSPAMYAAMVSEMLLAKDRLDALATLDVLEGDGLFARATVLGERIRVVLSEATAGNDAVLDVRGVGLMVGLELADAATCARVQARCLDEGLIVLSCGPDDSVLRLLPALTIPDDDLDHGLRILGEALADVA